MGQGGNRESKPLLHGRRIHSTVTRPHRGTYASFSRVQDDWFTVEPRTSWAMFRHVRGIRRFLRVNK